MRMVACDLDGTIVRRDGTVSRRTMEVLTACERSGVEVVFVTGRPPRWVLPIAQLTGHRGVALCGNGAAVLDLGSDQVVESHTLSVIDVLDAVTRLRVRLPGAAFALETMSGYRREPGFQTRAGAADDIPVGPLAELMIDHPPVLKILCRLAAPHDGTISTDAMLQVAREALAGVCEVVHSNPDGGMLEISALGVTKASALARLAAKLGIDARDVVAFGDMPNDVEMLAWAGTGYAMKGGHPAAIAAAAEVAPPCEQDGVAQVLERLLFPAVPKAALAAEPVVGPGTTRTVSVAELEPDPVSGS
jgi:Cof subfamily protein (haloacid dehalogenase superfamily)